MIRSREPGRVEVGWTHAPSRRNRVGGGEARVAASLGDAAGTTAAIPAAPRADLLAQPWFRTWALLLAPMLALVFVVYFVVQTDPDYWWHVRTGQYIVDTRTLPREDPFSYTRAGAPWVPHEWLTEVVFYAVQQSLGYVGNTALFAALGALTCLVVWETCRRRGLGELPATILMLFAFFTGVASIGNVRPQLVTALLLATYALLLTRYKQGDRRALWLMPPLMALWVNLHGGYLIGLVLLALTIAGEAINRLWRGESAPLRPLLIVSAATAAATLLSPNGLDGLLYPFSYAGTANASMKYIFEWQSPDFHKAYFYSLAASFLLLMLLGVARRPLGPIEALWTLGFAFMALQSVRHVPLYAIVTTPLLAARLQAELPALQRSITLWRRPALLFVTWPLLVVALLIALGQAEKAGLDPQLGREPQPTGYPAGAVQYLREHNLQGNLFNEYGWGGYLVYALYPERPVFIDGRADVYGDAFIERYVDVWKLRPGWRQVLDDYEIQLLLVRQDDPIANVLEGDPGWQLLYAGEAEKLFRRRAG